MCVCVCVCACVCVFACVCERVCECECVTHKSGVRAGDSTRVGVPLHCLPCKLSAQGLPWVPPSIMFLIMTPSTISQLLNGMASTGHSCPVCSQIQQCQMTQHLYYMVTLERQIINLPVNI